MNSARPTPREPRRRATILLALFLFSSFGLSRTLAEMNSTAEKLGAISVPVCLLAAGCWYAYKDGGRFARIAASALALLVVSAFGFGVVRGLDEGRAAQEINKELQGITDGLAADSTDTQFDAEAAKRHLQRTDEAVERLQSSDKPQAQAFARLMESLTKVMREPETRLIAALEQAGSERFMDVGKMLGSDDFAWQSSVAKEYEAAAQDMCVHHAKLPGVVEAELPRTGISKKNAEDFMLGYNRAWERSGRVHEAHLETAKSYVAVIEFIEKNRTRFEVDAEGGFSIPEPEFEAAYDQVVGHAVECDTRLETAVEALRKATAKR